MAKWVVVGASGFVGRGISEAIESAGYPVSKCTAPRLSADSDWSAERVVESMSDFVGEIEWLADRFSDHDIVVNAAGLATPGAPDSRSLFGANSVLPVVVLLAARRAGVSRYIHISSAAVQGRRRELDSSWDHQPFSPYSRSKAVAEASLRLVLDDADLETDVRIVRATSIQDDTRETTKQLIRFARSPFASVAAPGGAHSPVSTLGGLADFVLAIGADPVREFSVSVQPWEGLTVQDVIRKYGMKEPLRLPASLCHFALEIGYLLAKLRFPGIESIVRRAEVLWFGQSIRFDKRGIALD